MCDFEKILPELLDSKTIEKAYDDALSGPLKETSSAIVDLVKALKLFMAPIQLLASYQNRLTMYLNKVSSKVPERQHMVAPASIGGPIIEKFKYLEEDNILTELYMNLLARAIDKNRIGEAHPAFLYIIEQLAPDEAMLLYVLRIQEVETVEKRYFDPLNDIEAHINQTGKIVEHNFPENKLTYPALLSMYLSHLRSLELVEWVGYRKELKTISDSKKEETVYGKVVVNEFGKLFIKACIPEQVS